VICWSTHNECYAHTICATGDLIYEQWLKATDMPGINDFLTGVCPIHFFE